MKTISSTIFAMLFISFIIYAQDSTKLKNIQKETITKTVVVKGEKIETKVTETVKIEKQIIKIEDTGVENQNEVFSSEKKESVRVITDDVSANKLNDSLIIELKKAQLRQIEESGKQQLKKYEMEKKIIDERDEVKAMKRLEEMKKSGKKKTDN